MLDGHGGQADRGDRRGPGGIITGHRLLQAGYRDFVILDKAAHVGGTWQRNRYPGLSCDVPSHLYSFSFALKPDWTRPYAAQPEVLAYLEQCVDQLGLRPYIRLDTEVTAARWDDAAACWRVALAGGEELAADVVVSGQGMFGAARWPDIEGRERFVGTAIHTAHWRDDHDLTGSVCRDHRQRRVGGAAAP